MHYIIIFHVVPVLPRPILEVREPSRTQSVYKKKPATSVQRSHTLREDAASTGQRLNTPREHGEARVKKVSLRQKEVGRIRSQI
jgi:hypothetical protein